MSYNPYLYGQNPYQNLAQQQQIQFYQNQLQQLEQQQQAQNQLQQSLQNPVQNLHNNLVGKFVSSAEEITVSDVPMNGSYSIFPRQDMTEIYAKAWDGNGNIQTVVYRPVTQESRQESGNVSGVNAVDFIEELQTVKSEIMARFDALEKTGKAEIMPVKEDDAK